MKQHDLHTHTLFSSCCSDPEATVENYVSMAHELGYGVFGISDHLWDEKVPGSNSWYRGQTLHYVLEGKNCIPADTKGVRILFGAEVEYRGMADILAITAEDAKHFDYILVPHSHTHMRNFTMPEPKEIINARGAIQKKMQLAFPELREEQTVQMCDKLNFDDLYPFVKDQLDFAGYIADFLTDSFGRMLENPEFIRLTETVPVIIAHPFAPCEAPDISIEAIRRLDCEQIRALCAKAAERNVAFDINLGTYRLSEREYCNDPMVQVMRIAREEGVKFTIGTDSHSLAGLRNTQSVEPICRAIGITDADWSELVR